MEEELHKHTVSEPAYPGGKPEAKVNDEEEDAAASQHVKRRKKHAARSLDEMSSPAKKRNEVAPRSPLRSPSKTQNEPTYMNLRSLQPPTPKGPYLNDVRKSFGFFVPSPLSAFGN